MKHLEVLFDDLAAKVSTDKMLVPHYSLITQSLRKLYPNTNVMDIAVKAIGGEVAEAYATKTVEPVRQQQEAVYDEAELNSDDCPTCGKSQIQLQSIEPTQGIISETVISESDESEIGQFVKANDTKGFYKFLTDKKISVAKKFAGNMDKLIEAYEAGK